ncbi:hypothetical protein [Mesorhizobium mediterraneum]|uniref:hypothetical protein n=1 Tax=Mesorhizobium mediterraneum TaxID=43617 RepID=UPI0017832707|nr:hypothetical protein [Mesorhizobium mediterraneum]
MAIVKGSRYIGPMLSDRLIVRFAYQRGWQVVDGSTVVRTFEKKEDAFQLLVDRGARVWLQWSRTVIGGKTPPLPYRWLASLLLEIIAPRADGGQQIGFGPVRGTMESTQHRRGQVFRLNRFAVQTGVGAYLVEHSLAQGQIFRSKKLAEST